MGFTVTELSDDEAGKDAANSRSNRRVFHALSDNSTDGPFLAALATGIPAYGSQHPSDSYSRASSIVANRHQDNRRLFVVTVDYSTRSNDPATPPDNDPSPLNQPPEIELTFERSREPMMFDINMYPITNSAGQFPVPLPERDVVTPVLKIGRNILNIDASLFFAYCNTVNSDVFFNAQPGEVKLVFGNIKKLYSTQLVTPINPSGAYYNVTYELAFKPRLEFINEWGGPNIFFSAWDAVFLDAGYSALVDGELHKMIDQDNNFVSDPQPLDGGGRPLFEDPDIAWRVTPQHTAQEPFQYMIYELYQKVPFGPLGLLNLPA